MAGLGGIVRGAIAGAAGAAQDMAKGYIEDERRVSVQQQLSQIEEQRQLRIEEARERMRRTGRQADFEQDVANAPKRAETEAASKRVVGAAENEVAAGREGLVRGAAAEAERKAAGAYAADPTARAGVRAKAADTAAPDRGQSAVNAANAARLREEAADRAEKRRLQTELETAPPERAAQIERRLRVLDGKSPVAESDTVEVTTKGYDEAGNEVTTKKVEKRKPGGATKSDEQYPDAPKDMKQREIGKTYNSPRGPVIWRGNGWELVTQK